MIVDIAPAYIQHKSFSELTCCLVILCVSIPDPHCLAEYDRVYQPFEFSHVLSDHTGTYWYFVGVYTLTDACINKQCTVCSKSTTSVMFTG